MPAGLFLRFSCEIMEDKVLGVDYPIEEEFPVMKVFWVFKKFAEAVHLTIGRSGRVVEMQRVEY